MDLSASSRRFVEGFNSSPGIFIKNDKVTECDISAPS